MLTALLVSATILTNCDYDASQIIIARRILNAERHLTQCLSGSCGKTPLEIAATVYFDKLRQSRDDGCNIERLPQYGME